MATSGETTTGHGGGLRQVTMVALLVGGLVLLHRFAVPPDTRFDPTAMLAFGFIVLASYAIGQLVETIKLPHITGYLIAGVLLGPSIPQFLPEAWRLPPFDDGVLNKDVLDQLGLLDALAVALIALTAGGELKLAGLRKGLGAIGGLLIGQMITIGALVVGFVWSVSGVLPELTLPGLGPLSGPGLFALGGCVAAIAFATSPAATIAVINGASASGPVSRTVLSTVVLKDVFVLVLFSVASTMAGQALGSTVVNGKLGPFLLTHILGSLVVGGTLGAGVALYLRYVNQEVLLFLVGLVYTATFIANGLHLDPVLLFLAAGFAVANFSRKGDTLIHSVERLSMPVYVVFFTLAGAQLPLSVLIDVAPFAGALVGLRAFAIWLGVLVGGHLGRADRNTKRFGWLGFLSQAGVAISLTGQLDSFGAPGEALAALLLSTIALNELVGPVLLKLGLALSGELAGTQPATEEQPRTEEPTAASGEPKPEEWKEQSGPSAPWSKRPQTSSPALRERIDDLQSDLQALVRDLEEGPLEEFRRNAETYLRELRREFLRHHLRVSVQARDEEDVSEKEAAKTRAELATRLRSEQAEMAERWRGIVLGRAARLRKGGWNPDELVSSIDRLVEGLPAEMDVPWEPSSFRGQPREGLRAATLRSGLRLRRGLMRLVGSDLQPRTLPLRPLVRYHLSGKAAERFEGLATLLVQADQHLTSRTRSIFEAVVEGYDQLAKTAQEEEVDPKEELGELHSDVEEELALAFDEVSRMIRDVSRRASLILGESLDHVKDEVATFGTFDLPVRARRSTRVYRARVRALETLTDGVAKTRQATAAGYSRLAMELELIGLEARVKDVLEEQVSRLEGDVRGRAMIQSERVRGALTDALARLDETIAEGGSGPEMADTIRKIATQVDKVVGEAGRAALQLQEQLSADEPSEAILSSLGRAARGITDRYEISGRLPRAEWRLPSAPTTVEVPFRELVHAHIDTQIAPKLIASLRQMAEQVQPLVTSLGELERLVAFNVELATGEIEVVVEDRVPSETRALIKDMLGGAFERSRSTIAGYVDASRSWPEQLSDALRTSVLGVLEELRGQLVDGDVSRARIDSMRRAATGLRLMREAGALPSRLARARLEVRRTLRRMLGEDRLDRWRIGLGLPAVTTGAGEDAGSFTLPNVTKQLPVVYRRLFAPNTLEASDVLTGREADIARARRVLAGGSPARLRAVALVGPDGVGKAAVATAIVRARAWKNVRRLNFNQPMSEGDVADLFKDKSEGHLIVVDGLHWMVSMCPGGFAPLRRFVDGVIADGGRNAWLVQGDRLFWRYASEVAPLGEAFPELVRLEPLSVAELRQAVLARHALSGYGLNFEPERPRGVFERLVVRIAGRVRRPYDRYFRKLHEASGGLVRDALRLWLASIDRVDEREDFMHVGPLPRPPAAALRRLSDDMLLNLYVVARQGWMDAAVQAWLFRVDRSTAEAQLARLAHLRLLERKGHVYRIAVHLRGAVEQTLSDRGWIR